MILEIFRFLEFSFRMHFRCGKRKIYWFMSSIERNLLFHWFGFPRWPQLLQYDPISTVKYNIIANCAKSEATNVYVHTDLLQYRTNREKVKIEFRRIEILGLPVVGDWIGKKTPTKISRNLWHLYRSRSIFTYSKLIFSEFRYGFWLFWFGWKCP